MKHPETTILNELEMIAMDIISDTPFDDSLPSDKDDPEADFLLGPPTMAPFEVLIEEAREKADDLHQFFAIVDVIFREYERRCEARLMVMFSDPEPYIDWMKNRIDKRRKEFYQEEAPSESDRKYEEVCKMMIGEVPDSTTMVDVDVELEGMPMQGEIEAEHALFCARCEVRAERDAADQFKHAVKERIRELEWNKLAKQAEDLKLAMEDLGIDFNDDEGTSK